MQKRLLTSLLLIPLFLTGCFSGEESASTTIAPPGMKIYESSEFSIQFPQDWQIVEGNDFTSTTPSSAQVGFVNNIINEKFTANLNVTIRKASKDLTSSDLAKSNNAKTKANLVELSIQSTIESDNGITTNFQGKKAPSSPIIIFSRLDRVSNGNAYSTTAAHLPEEDESVVNALNEMLDSFSLK
ncbi:hypothetical protein JKY72_00740 [Candidatus Gracilibacteria bacterium]|nr:hypothetical protein [Candidatus Gracilibacteria bacterium]